MILAVVLLLAVMSTSEAVRDHLETQAAAFAAEVQRLEKLECDDATGVGWHWGDHRCVLYEHAIGGYGWPGDGGGI